MDDKLRIVSPPVYKKSGKSSPFVIYPNLVDYDPYKILKSYGFEVNSVPEQSSEEIEEEFQENYWFEDQYGHRKLNENVFAEAFTEIYKLNYANGSFYSIVGAVSEEKV